MSKNVKFGIKCENTFDIGNELYELRPALDFRSWLLSPNNWNGSNANVFFVSGSSYPGGLNSSYVDSTGGVRPAVSLKSCVKTSGGDGSASAPYTIEETTSTSGC